MYRTRRYWGLPRTTVHTAAQSRMQHCTAIQLHMTSGRGGVVTYSQVSSQLACHTLRREGIRLECKEYKMGKCIF